VVIKRLRREASRDIAPFLREYRIHRQLSHPSIPRALELGFTRDEDKLCPYIVLEHVDGVSLARWVAERLADPERAAREGAAARAFAAQGAGTVERVVAALAPVLASLGPEAVADARA